MENSYDLGGYHCAALKVRGSTSPPATPAEDSPVLVLGVDHSGTTILYRMLAYHPSLAWFSQFSLRGGQIPGRTRRPGADRLDRVLRRFPHGWQKSRSRVGRFIVPRPGEEPPIWNYLLQDEATDAARVRSCLRAFSKRFDGQPVLAKRPAFLRHLDLLHAAFPQARYVHIVRDGRPVALSLRDKKMRLEALAGGELDPGETLHESALEWVDGLERVHSTPGIDPLEIRYEDLCADVHGVIGSVLRHAGLDTESFPFGRCPPTLSQRNARWVETATNRELAEISEIQRDSLLKYRYSPEPPTG
jgi:hypothetical protein